MSRQRRWFWWLGRAFVMVGTISACRDDPEIRTLPDSLLAGIDERGRLLADSRLVVPLESATHITLPATAAGYTMTMPTSVAAADAPICALAVADLADEAVHVFSLRDEYRYSVFGGSRGHPLFPQPMSVVFAANGSLMVADQSGLVVVVDRQGVVSDTFRLPEESHRLRQLATASDARVYENVFAGPPAVATDAQTAQLPLVRVWRWRGSVLGSLGAVQSYPGRSFTQALNMGSIAVVRDTLWFARYADARVLAFSTDHPSSMPLRVLELPLYYQMNPPVEGFLASTGQLQNVVARHLTAFAVDPDGNLFFGQRLSGPAGNPTFRPQTVLATTDRRGGDYRAFDLNADIRGLAAARRWLYATVRADRGYAVLRLENPRFKGHRGNVDCR